MRHYSGSRVNSGLGAVSPSNSLCRAARCSFSIFVADAFSDTEGGGVNAIGAGD